MNANSLKNLRPFPKGISGNPGGRPSSTSLPEHLREIRSLTNLEVIKIISKYARLDYQTLKDFLDLKQGTALELHLASIFIKGIEYGDYGRLSFLLDRAIGKVKDIPEDETDPLYDELRKLSTQDLLLRLHKLSEQPQIEGPNS